MGGEYILIKKESCSLDYNNSFVDVSVIIPSKNEGKNLKFTVDSIIKSKNYLGFEVIIVDDESTDSSTEFLNHDSNKNIYKNVILIKTDGLGVAGARNAGAKIAKGNYLFFCDAHIKVPNQWLDNLVSTLKNSNVQIVAPCIVNMKNPLSAGYGMSWDDKLRPIWLPNKFRRISEIPFVCGCAFGITAEVFKKMNGFDRFFQVYGSEDFELCLRAWLYGYKVALNPKVRVEHLFKEVHQYEITASNVIFNILCLAYSHFNKERLIKIINIMKNEYSFSKAAADIKNQADGILRQRERYFKERIYDDNFFFEKFNIHF
jgi:GT2 family glycosyltransferase